MPTHVVSSSTQLCQGKKKNGYSKTYLDLDVNDLGSNMEEVNFWKLWLKNVCVAL